MDSLSFYIGGMVAVSVTVLADICDTRTLLKRDIIPIIFTGMFWPVIIIGYIIDVIGQSRFFRVNIARYRVKKLVNKMGEGWQPHIIEDNAGDFQVTATKGNIRIHQDKYFYSANVDGAPGYHETDPYQAIENAKTMMNIVKGFES